MVADRINVEQYVGWEGSKQFLGVYNQEAQYHYSGIHCTQAS